MYRCGGFNGSGEHFVSFDEMKKNSKNKSGVGSICKEHMRMYNNDKSKNCQNNAKKVYKDLKKNSKNRKHPMPDFTEQEFIDVYCKTKEFIVEQGENKLVFPVTHVGGHFNTISPDRIDDNKHYTWENIRLVPIMLNINNAFTNQELIRIIHEDVRLTTEQEHESIAHDILMGIKSSVHYDDVLVVKREETKEISFNKFGKRCRGKGKEIVGRGSKGFIYSMATNAQTKMRVRLEPKNGNCEKFTVVDFMKIIIQIMIKDGFRCHYTHVPLVFRPKSGCFMASIERKDTSLEYNTPNNDVLICSGLNYGVVGQRHSELSKEERNQQRINGSFNQDYWDSVYHINDEKRKLRQIAFDHHKNEILKYLKMDHDFCKKYLSH